MAKYWAGIAAHYVEFGLIKITFDNTCVRKNQLETFAHQSVGRSPSNKQI